MKTTFEDIEGFTGDASILLPLIQGDTPCAFGITMF